MAVAELRRLATEFRWMRTGLGLLGNTSFFVGSIFFFWESTHTAGVFWESTHTAGVWRFVVGAFGMMIGSTGEAVVRYERRELNI